MRDVTSEDTEDAMTASLIAQSYIAGRKLSLPVAKEETSLKKTMEDQVDDLVKLNGGKNSVTIRTEKGATHFDLKGAAHKGTPTPHVQYSYKNVNPNTGQTFLNKDRGPASPITQQQIRLIRKFLEKQN